MGSLWGWVKGIAFFLLLVTLVEHVLPKSYRKYLKVCTGTLLILMIAVPVLQLLGKESLLNQNYWQQQLQSLSQGIEPWTEVEEMDREAVMVAQYKNQLVTQAAQIARLYELQLVEGSVTIDEDSTSQSYGRITGFRAIVAEHGKEMPTAGTGIESVTVAPITFEETEEEGETVYEGAISANVVAFKGQLAADFALTPEQIEIVVQ